jgi:uncharacterized protein YbcV (DUF1398 family)
LSVSTPANRTRSGDYSVKLPNITRSETCPLSDAAHIHFILTRKRISMSQTIANLEEAQKRAMELRPKVGGFPYLAETLRRAGVIRNVWVLPACQSLYLTNEGPVVTQGTPLTTGTVDVPPFDRSGLIAAIRKDQAGESSFQEFLVSSWRAGVIRYDVDFEGRTVSYYGCNGEEYVEEYPAVEVD